MVFTPIVGSGGFLGFQVLQRTQENQRAAFDRSPQLNREIEYFRANAANATSAEALVTDRQLLTVALGAFGLGEEIDKRAFVRRMLEEGVREPTSFANRQADPRYRELVGAFNFDDVVSPPAVSSPEFIEDLIARYKVREFENAVGEVDTDIRLALNFQREIPAIINSENADRSGFLRVLGNQALREVVATAVGLPAEAAQIDIDRQTEILADRFNSLFGERSITALRDPANAETIIRRFFLFKQIQSGPGIASSGANALTILGAGGLGGVGQTNLLLSQV